MIKAMFNVQKMEAQLKAKVAKIESKIVEVLARRGEEFVTMCRDENTYKDQTGNLRSSIGYFIFKGNYLLISDTKQIAGEKGNGSEGLSTVLSLVNGISKSPDTYYLIGVAGMNYAAEVEARGLNVISNQAIQIVSLLEGDFEKLKNKIS